MDKAGLVNEGGSAGERVPIDNPEPRVKQVFADYEESETGRRKVSATMTPHINHFP